MCLKAIGLWIMKIWRSTSKFQPKTLFGRRVRFWAVGFLKNILIWVRELCENEADPDQFILQMPQRMGLGYFRVVRLTLLWSSYYPIHSFKNVQTLFIHFEIRGPKDLNLWHSLHDHYSLSLGYETNEFFFFFFLGCRWALITSQLS